MSVAWMLPGQGSQSAGMASELSACKDLFEEARSIIDADLERICSSEPKGWPAELIQPALFTTCVGAGRALAAQGLSPDAVLGHSLGEFAALVVSGAMEFGEGLRLVAVRGRATAAAARTNPGGMAAVIGLPPETLSEVCAEIGDVWVANLNSHKQTVISGRDASLAKAAEKATELGALKVIRLQVPIAGHSPLMEPAVEPFKEALDQTTLQTSMCLFYSCVDAGPHTDPGEIRGLLVRAITSPVRFADAIRAIHHSGINGFVEVGPGRVLVGLARQILHGASLASVGTDREAEALVFPSRSVRLEGQLNPASAGAQA